MKFITRKTHAVLDYIMGVLLIASPWILGLQILRQQNGLQ